MAKEEAVEMFVGGLLLDRNTQAPVVVLKDEAGEISLPIWIGIAEATSIASAINQISMARPLTHDLMHHMFVELGVNVQRILITELKDATYFAELVVSYGDKVLIFDARPSDAIALALRSSAPIFVAQSVLDQAKITFSGMQMPTGQPDEEGGAEQGGEGEAAPPAEGEKVPEGQPTRGDFTNIDKEKWKEILNELDPDDFKYKM